MKHENKQRGLNKKIVNEDAYYKLLAYSSVIDRDNDENDQKKEIIDIENVSTGFKDFYRRELKKEM
jgi:predicted patatin/cPLA2 family phospholipase